MVAMPVLYYMLWSATHSLLIFKMAANLIKKKGYENMYQLFCNMGIVKKLLGSNISPAVYICIHFTMFFMNHLAALLQYHNFWVSTAFVSFYSIISVWNGAQYYMEYFCKKYETQL